MLSLHSSTSVNKSDGNDDDQSDVTRMMLVDDGDLLAMMLTMNCFGLFRINVTNFFFYHQFTQKYLYNIML